MKNVMWPCFINIKYALCRDSFRSQNWYYDLAAIILLTSSSRIRCQDHIVFFFKNRATVKTNQMPSIETNRDRESVSRVSGKVTSWVLIGFLSYFLSFRTGIAMTLFELRFSFKIRSIIKRTPRFWNDNRIVRVSTETVNVCCARVRKQNRLVEIGNEWIFSLRKKKDFRMIHATSPKT